MGVIGVSNFSLKHTLESGQFFRYYLIDGWYYLVSRDKVFKLRQKGDLLYYEGNCGEDFLVNFLGLDHNLDSVIKFAHEKNLQNQFEKCAGLRIMNQDLWECLVGFVCSSASNIKKIKSNLNLISQYFGKAVQFDGKTFYTFPEPGELKDMDKLKLAKTGYRAKYLFDINTLVDERFLKQLRLMKYGAAKKVLCSLPGVGEKIADCVLLFSLSHRNAFPVDVWIKRVMETLYFSGEKTSIKKIREFASVEFGDNSGYVQQYLYHYGRNHG
jgi:N-glycosylase/DNA lyase